MGSNRALVLHPRLKDADDGVIRDPEARLEEAMGLTHAIELECVHGEIVTLNNPRPGTLLGPGQVERYGELAKALEVDVVVIDRALTPVQQRNLEAGMKQKVIDRTQLILEIFGARARTHEGRLQVDLASMMFQRSRLVRSWTHLERQRGGAGFMGGPGESQLEIDRRLIGERITKLKRELEDVRRTRELHRDARKRVPFPIVALVGYTNAGKSSLFNRLSGAEVMAKDLLFATLDPTMRRIDLPNGRRIILSDTVGFISDLPTHLVAAFRATLEEVMEADVILHVRDISHPDTEAQKQDVISILSDLEIDHTTRPGRIVEVLNKIDLLDDEGVEQLTEQISRETEPTVMVSALTSAGTDTLAEVLDRILAADDRVAHLRLDPTDGSALAWLYAHGDVISREDEEAAVSLSVSLDPVDLARFQKRFSASIFSD